MTDTLNIEDAAKLVMDSEVAALNKLKSVLDELETQLEEIEATLPVSITMDAKRIVMEIRSAFNYRRVTELPQIISRATLNEPSAE